MNIYNKCLICSQDVTSYIRGLYDDRYGAPGRHEVYICKYCGFGKTVPGIIINQIGKFYKRYYPLASQSAEYIRSSIHKRNKLLDWYLGLNNSAHFYITQGSTVLDIGCGAGVSLLEIEDGGSKAYGVEPDGNSQRLAKTLNLKIYKGLIYDHPFRGMKFDYITASQVVEHDPNPVDFLKTAKQRLKKNGKIILTFPNFNSPYRRILGRKWLHWHIPYHLNFFTKKSIEILSSSLGLKINTYKTITPNVWTILQLRMLFYNPYEGVMSGLWALAHDKSENIQSDSNLRTKALTFMNLIFPFLISIVNRPIDLLNFGDSILLILEKNDF